MTGTRTCAELTPQAAHSYSDTHTHVMPPAEAYEVLPQHEDPEHDGGAERPGGRRGRARRQLLRAVSMVLGATVLVALIVGVVQRGGHQIQRRGVSASAELLSSSSVSRQRQGGPAPGQQAGTRTSPVGSSAINRTARDASLHVHARETELYRASRGTFDPRTGVMLLQCSDSVSWGKWGSTDTALIGRFHAEPGTRFTVECPTRCASALPLLYGCAQGPYMDESSICKAAGNYANRV